MIYNKIYCYVVSNVLRGLQTSPFKTSMTALSPVPLYIFVALIIGFSSGLLQWNIIKTKMVFILPITLFFFPSLFEEILFRGLLIPNNAGQQGKKRMLFYLLISTVLFVVWHPINALTLNPAAQSVFLNPFFLLITALLGVTCGISYIVSRSLWIPVIIHWLTVVAWVIFLGGRNLLLELL